MRPKPHNNACPITMQGLCNLEKLEIACGQGKISMNKKSETSFVPMTHLCIILQLWQSVYGNYREIDLVII